MYHHNIWNRLWANWGALSFVFAVASTVAVLIGKINPVAQSLYYFSNFIADILGKQCPNSKFIPMPMVPLAFRIVAL